MSSDYSEEYFRKILIEAIYPSLHENRLDLNNITVDEADPVPSEDLGWAIQTMEANSLLQRLDDFNYDLTEAGLGYLQALLQTSPQAESQPEQQPEQQPRRNHNLRRNQYLQPLIRNLLNLKTARQR